MSRKRSYAVWLNERRVGWLRVYEDVTHFVLARDYIEDGNRAVLGLRFEEDLVARRRANMRLPVWFSNLLPEGTLRTWVADARGVSPVREVELLAELGGDLPGAVYVTSETDANAELDTRPREVVSGGANARGDDNGWRFSLAGVAMKFSMLQRGERFTAPAVGEGGDWIVKLPDDRYSQVPMNEFAMMQFARLVQLNVPKTKLVPRELLTDIPDALWPPHENVAYAVKRFDRAAHGVRVHMEDFAQVRGFYPDDKYAGSFETVASLVYRGRDVVSLTEFVRRLAFNILIRNGDAHLKNWSLLYVNPRIPVLSPAYDLVATAVYQPTPSVENLGLKFGGNRRFESATLATFERLQQRLGVRDISLAEEVRMLVHKV